MTVAGYLGFVKFLGLFVITAKHFIISNTNRASCILINSYSASRDN